MSRSLSSQGQYNVPSLLDEAPYYAKHAMRDMSQILTKYLHCSGSIPTQQLGALVYHMHVISRLKISSEHVEQYAQDVAELASESFDIAQKLHVLDRMYRNYPFVTA